MNIIEKIRAEIISRIDKRHLSAQAQNELVSILSFLDTFEEDRPEPYNPVYDEAYLNEKIALRKKNGSWENYEDFERALAEVVVEVVETKSGGPSLHEYASRLLEIANGGSSEKTNNHEGLDEAAEEYATICFKGHYYPTCDESFIAGAEWAMGQGMIREGKIVSESGEVGWIEYDTPAPVELMEHFKKGDEIVLQIRKK